MPSTAPRPPGSECAGPPASRMPSTAPRPPGSGGRFPAADKTVQNRTLCGELGGLGGMDKEPAGRIGRGRVGKRSNAIALGAAGRASHMARKMRQPPPQLSMDRDFASLNLHIAQGEGVRGKMRCPGAANFPQRRVNALIAELACPVNAAPPRAGSAAAERWTGVFAPVRTGAPALEVGLH
jgi:hypothetical protein